MVPSMLQGQPRASEFHPSDFDLILSQVPQRRNNSIIPVSLSWEKKWWQFSHRGSWWGFKPNYLKPVYPYRALPVARDDLSLWIKCHNRGAVI